MQPQGRGTVAWNLVVAVIMVAPYVPTLFSGFDFNDDGCLAYAVPVHGVGSWLTLVADLTQDDFHRRGPYRPITWMHWTAAAEMFGDNPLAHRAVRLGWSYVAACLFLWLLAELGVGGWAAFFATAVAFWSPFRNEYWLGLGLTEAFGTPYGFLALIAAVRAARSARPWGWDILGWSCAVCAIGCKNTFAAVVPAMLFLRVATGGQFAGETLVATVTRSLRAGWVHVLFLGSTLLLPIAHLVALKLDPFPKEYTVAGLSWQSFSLWPRALFAAFGFDYLAPALALLGLSCWRTRTATVAQQATDRTCQTSRPVLFVAGLLLVLAGVGVYLPMSPGVSGRYTVPAAWGCDLILALLFQVGLALPKSCWKKAFCTALIVGCTAMLIANIGKQSKWQGRADLFWQVVHVVEDEVPQSSKVAWVGSKFPKGDEIGLGEGTHFGWHLDHRGRKMVVLMLVDEKDPHGLDSANFACTGRPDPPPGRWQLLHSFQARYWLGLRSYACYLWQAS